MRKGMRKGKRSENGKYERRGEKLFLFITL